MDSVVVRIGFGAENYCRENAIKVLSVSLNSTMSSSAIQPQAVNQSANQPKHQGPG